MQKPGARDRPGGCGLKADDLEVQAPGTTYMYVVGHRVARLLFKKPPESDGPAEHRAVCQSANQE